MSTFRLQIVTPDGSLFDGEAEALRVRTTEGYISIRKGHADYVAALDIGTVTVTQDGKARDAACGGGFLSVEKGEAERAAHAKEVAEARIAAATEARDIELAKAKLARALTRLSVANQK